MQWASTAEFFAMGGYGLYVWGSFGACALLMVLEPVFAAHRMSTAMDQLRRQKMADALDHETSLEHNPK